MGDDAVITLGYDNARVRAGARETEALMNRASGKVTRDWDKTSKSLKDVFDPMSRGALAKLGGVGVALFGVTTAVGRFRAKVDELAVADYLTPAQQADMQAVSEGFRAIEQGANSLLATAISASVRAAASIGGLFTGEDYAANADAIAAAERSRRATENDLKLRERRKALAEQQLGPAERLAALEQRHADLGDKIAERENQRGTTVAEITAREQQLLDMRGQQVDIEGQILALKKQIADEGARETKEAQKKVEGQKRFAQELERSMKIMEAQARGNQRQVKKLEREGAIETRAAEISRQLGVSGGDARAIATREQDLQDRAAGRASGRIRGYTGGQKPFGDGLAGLYALRARHTFGPKEGQRAFASGHLTGFDLYEARKAGRAQEMTVSEAARAHQAGRDVFKGTQDFSGTMIAPPKAEPISKPNGGAVKLDSADMVAVLKEIAAKLTVE